MSAALPFGVGALAIAAYILIVSFATDSIPAKWPLVPKYRDDYPDAFNRHIILWLAVGASGLCVIIAGLF